MDSTPQSSASHDVHLRATVFAGHWPTIPAQESDEVPPGTFSPTTATLISGPTEIVLIDALHLEAAVQELGDLIERTGKRLTTIYVTHDHADHYLGIGPLLERFPGAKAVTLPHILESMRTTWDAQAAQWKVMFGDKTVPHGPMPEALEGTTLYVDGSPVHVVPVKQADIRPTSIVHIPAIDVVVAGDAIYNEAFPMLALSTPGLARHAPGHRGPRAAHGRGRTPPSRRRRPRRRCHDQSDPVVHPRLRRRVPGRQGHR